MSVAPQVDVPILGRNNAGTSAGATGGILKYTPTAEVIAPQVNVYVAPQVDVPILGRVLLARPQEPPEVYTSCRQA